MCSRRSRGGMMRHLILAVFLILITRAVGASEAPKEFDPCVESTQENLTQCVDTCGEDLSMREKAACKQSCDVQWYSELKYCHQKTIALNI